MNKLITNIEGQMPFVLDDIRWFADGIYDAFANLIETLGGNMILFGCETSPSGNNYEVSAGALALDGEIYKVDAHTAIGESGAGYADWYFVPDISYSAEGTKTFGNGTIHETYEIRKAKLIYSETEPAAPFMRKETGIRYIDKLFSKLESELNDKANVWSTVSSVVNDLMTGITASETPFRFIKKLGIVYIEASLLNFAFTYSGEIYTLPVGYRPDRKIHFTVNSEGHYVTINPDGRITTNLVSDNFFFNVSFRAAKE